MRSVLAAGGMLALSLAGFTWPRDGGAGAWHSAEAVPLANVAVAEVVGTPDYLRHPASAPWWQAALAKLHLPLADPYGMVAGAILPSPITPPAVPAHEPAAAAPLPAASTANTANAQAQGDATGSFAAGPSSVILGWAPDTTADATIQLMAEHPGLTVISPKWLTVWSSTGMVKSDIQPEVIAWAHQHHIKVWPLLDNQFSARLTHDLLSDPSHIARAVDELAHLAAASGIDGINVDFENVRPEDRDAFTAFIGKLHQTLARRGVNLSVDITPDIAFLRDDAAFFHAGLAAVCDELVLMAYDEHWGGDPEPGPVADVPWTTQAVEDLLNTGVPANRLILGLPFYTRFWYVHRDGSVTSEAVASGHVADILRQHGANGQYQPELGVGYARYGKPDGYMEVWYDTEETLAQKLRLVREEGLAGVAVWALSLPNPAGWRTVVAAMYPPAP
ncbi:hypothetical protein GCM10010885_01700 [Alicyclobacillus cellulosilyticus]|uniref:GH18 domain-containing protein n=2 Tax=Alicyclobacillus cellulosilyticus TaxID=1003997 RepID=A0A917K3I5_9BACL|nr:hypothetical protein GCM10010885_01700 [Alicyclobacillus cellulosilyticus]